MQISGWLMSKSGPAQYVFLVGELIFRFVVGATADLPYFVGFGVETGNGINSTIAGRQGEKVDVKITVRAMVFATVTICFEILWSKRLCSGDPMQQHTEAARARNTIGYCANASI